MKTMLLFVGDVMLGRLVNKSLATNPPSHPWGDTLSVFHEADVRFCNLECVIADGGRPWRPGEKVFHFRSDAKNVAVLQAAQIACVTNANNHALDYGQEALLEMLSILEREEIHHAGAGKSAEEALAPARFEKQGLHIGLMALSDNEPDWEAGPSTPGIYYTPIDPDDSRAQRFFARMADLKEQVDCLVVSAHWGPNWGYEPRPHHVPFAHALVEHGADIIFGHSCHVFQGIEVYRGTPILYSCGDFVDDYRVHEVERNDQSFIFMIEWEDKQVRGLRLYPTHIARFQAHLADGVQAERIARKMQTLCAKLGTEAAWNSGGFLEISL